MSVDPANDEILLRRAGAGDADAAGALWSRQRRWVAACVLAHVPAGTDLDDLLQDVALQMWQSLGELRDPGSLRPWLRSIALNAARSRGRRESLRQRTLRPLEADPTPIDDAAVDRARCADATRDELGEVLRRIEHLPPIYREPLLLRAVERLSQRAIAELLGLAETTVETRLARARRMLREQTEDARGTRRTDEYGHDLNIRRTAD